MASSLSLPVISRGYWDHPADSGALGCSVCQEDALCGGLRSRTGAFSCLDYCCGNPSSCQWVCRNNPEQFVARVREIGGFELEKLPRLAETRSSAVPTRVPLIFHASGRHEALRVPIVAVKMNALLKRSDHCCKWQSREDLLTALKVDSNANLIVDGIGVDSSLERFWGAARAAGAVSQIAALKPTWVITPNYSMISDVPRWDNLHSMKRIAQIWHEFTAEGVPTALHVNARTITDWDRWTAFIAPRSEVTAVSFEFATGGKFKERREAFTEQLIRLGDSCDRRLRLFLRGGKSVVRRLSHSFLSVTISDPNAFMKTMKRRRLDSASKRTWTLLGQPIDELLCQNIQSESHGFGETAT
jgi:hypothetical protein